MTHGGDLIVQLMDFDGCTAENTALNEHAAVFQMVDCLSAAFGFDTEEYRYALTEDTTYQASKSYYSYSNGTYTLMTSDTDYTVGASIPTETVYEANPNNSGPSTVTTNFGSNTWSNSTVRQFLNSEESKNNWFIKTKIYDACSYANTYDGFLRGLDSTLKACLVPVRRIVAVSNSWGGGSSTTIDKIFLLTKYELFGSRTNNVNEGKKQWDYWAAHKENDDRIKTNNETAVNWWLSSPETISFNIVQYINDSGSLTGYYARQANYLSLCFCV